MSSRRQFKAAAIEGPSRGLLTYSVCSHYMPSSLITKRKNTNKLPLDRSEGRHYGFMMATSWEKIYSVLGGVAKR